MTSAAEVSRPVTVHRGPILAIILVSYLIIVLNISIVITALPAIQAEMGLSTAGVSWVQNAYTLAFGGLLLVGARAGDILGRRRMFVVGVAVFTAASLAIGLATSDLSMIAARALQGVGAAILAPSSLALIPASFPEGEERTRAVAFYGAIAGIGSSIGMVLGGILTHALSWRLGFFVNLPIGLGLIWAALRFLSETDRRPGSLDLIGGITSTLGMTALVYGIVQAAAAGWLNPVTVISLTIGVVLVAIFIANEARVEQPIMPLHLFASRERSAAYAARALFLGAMMGFWFFATLFLQKGLGFTPFEGGLGFLPMTITSFVVALCVPCLTARFGNGRLLGAGILIAMVGMAWLSRLSGDSQYVVDIALPMIFIGIGQGAALSPLTAAGISGTDPKDAGAASGLVNVAHQLGSSIGLGLLVTIFASSATADFDGAALLAYRIGVSLTVATGMLGLALLLVWLLILQTANGPRTCAT